MQRDITMQLTEGQLNRLLKRPEDDEDNVKNTLKVYRQIMLPLLQDFMAGKMRGRLEDLGRGGDGKLVVPEGNARSFEM